MGIGGGHPGEVAKFKVLKVKPTTVLLEMSLEDAEYFADKVGKNGVADFRFDVDGGHDSGPETATSA